MRYAFYLALIGIVCALPTPTVAQDWTGNVNAFLGVKTLDKDEWEPADEHDAFGVMADFGPTSWPVAFAVGVRRSDADETVGSVADGFALRLEAETQELSFGVKKIWTPGRTIRPYIAGGVTRISAEATGHVTTVRFIPPINITIETTVGPEDDEAIGPWIGGGLYWTLGNAFNLGLDLRYSSADVEVFGVDVDGGGTHAGVLLGYHW